MKQKRFIKPTVKQVETYCKEKGYDIDAEYFVDKNEEKGWVTGKNNTPIKDWKATIRTWVKNKERWSKEKQHPDDSPTSHLRDCTNLTREEIHHGHSYSSPR